MNSPDWIQLTIARMYKLPEGWQWCRSEVIGEAGHFRVEGGVPRVLTRGPRKGRRTWDKAVLTAYVITRSDIKETEALYSKQSQACGGDEKDPTTQAGRT